MEIVVWNLGDETQAKDLCESYGVGWPGVELTQFFYDALFVPLYSILLNHARKITYSAVFDKRLYSDHDLNDPVVLAALHNDEFSGAWVQRVNPELVGLLAAVAPARVPSLAEEWLESQELRRFFAEAWTEDEARSEVHRLLTELTAFAKLAVAENKAIMQRFHL